jgi:hypothetical protein
MSFCAAVAAVQIFPKNPREDRLAELRGIDHQQATGTPDGIELAHEPALALVRNEGVAVETAKRKKNSPTQALAALNNWTPTAAPRASTRRPAEKAAISPTAAVRA